MNLIEEGAALLSAISTGVLLGHNLWLVAPRVRPVSRELQQLEINTSDLFPESETAISEDRIEEFAIFADGAGARLEGYRVVGASLIAEVAVGRCGALLAALTLHPRTITLEPGKFHSYLREEEAWAVIDARDAAGESSRPGREIYTKYAKAFAIDGEEDSDLFRRSCGHRLEIHPLANPCALRAGERLSLQVTLDGAPAQGARVSVGCEGLNGGAALSHATVAADGRAEILVPGPGRWCVRTHWIRPHANRSVADWESFWSSLTVLGKAAAPVN